MTVLTPCYRHRFLPHLRGDTGGTPPAGGGQYISIDTTTTVIYGLSLRIRIEKGDPNHHGLDQRM